MEDYTEEQIDLRDYLRVLRKRRWTILTVFSVVLLTVAVHTFSVVPTYQAIARIVIEKENPNLVSIQEVMSVDATGSDYYQTQYKIIESRAVAREVIKRLGLENSPEFFPEPRDDLISRSKVWFKDTLNWWVTWLDSLTRGDRSRSSELTENAESQLVTDLIDRISVSPIRNSRLVDVGVDATDPNLAARISNELVRAYIDQNLGTKLDAAKDAVQWLSEQIDAERKKVEIAENDLLRYKEQYGIITDFSSDAEKITAQKLAQLNQQVVEAEAQRVEAETRYQQALAVKGSPDLIDSIPEVLDNELVREIKKMEVILYTRMSELSKKYGRKHPQMIAIDSELKDLQQRKETEFGRVINSLRNNYKISLAREASLKKALAQQKKESMEMNQKAVQYGVLRRQAESARNMYELLVKRFKETSLTEEMKTGNIRIVDKAEVPMHPINPKKMLNMLLAMVVGLTLSIGLAFFLEYLDNTIKIPDEIKSHLKVPYLGSVPVFSTNRNRERFPDLITDHTPKSPVSESFRGIRTGILFSSANSAPQVILITSSGPEEGKTSCASNLAVTMAQSGSKVILIDCDMRRPKLHRKFRIDRDVGISNVLVGSAALNEVIVPTGIDNLSLIPCGPIPPNPSEILGSEKMAQVLEALKKGYTRVLIDSPPVSAVTDSSVLAKMVDGTVLVVRAGETPRPAVKNGIEQLKSVNSNILGAVLNGIRPGRDGYYHYQYYYYYYGEKGKKKHKGHRKEKHADV